MFSASHKKFFKNLSYDYDSDHEVINEQGKFLKTIWCDLTTHKKMAFAALAFRKRNNGQFIEKFVETSDLKNIKHLLSLYNRWDYDQYFCPNTFYKQSRKKKFANITMLAWCDIDEADYSLFKPQPSIVWETSPRRTQALWIWHKKYCPTVAERFSCSLTYRYDGDKNGWPINKLLRLPGSINHKQEYNEPYIPILRCDLTLIKRRPRTFKDEGRNYTSKTSRLDVNHKKYKRLDVFKKYSSNLDGTARQLIKHNEVVAPDRSLRIYQLISGLNKAGASIDEIASVLWDSPYFQSKYPDNITALNNEISRILIKIGGTL